MTAKVTVYLGPARSGKTSELLRHYAEALQHGPKSTGRALWLAPTRRSVAEVRSQLIALEVAACLAPGVMTFGDLARETLTASGSRLRLVAPAMERELVRRAVHAATQLGELEFFAESAKRDGFVDLVVQHIRELRRHGVTAQHYARLPKSSDDPQQHEELARLYSAHQKTLEAAALVDSEGLVWAASGAMKHPSAGVKQHFALVVADGFSDFTAGQHELLRLLAQHSDQLIISLPGEAPSSPLRTGRSSDESNTAPPPPRPDLFAKSAATLAALRRSFPKLSQHHVAAQATSWPALDHIRRNLFQPPGRVESATADVLKTLDGVEFIEAAGAQDEIVQIAQRIKRLLTTPLPLREGQREGSARPSDILVVFRSVAEAATRIREVFQQFGIPYYLESGRPVASTALFKSLLALVRLHEQNWPFRATIAVITNNTLWAFDAAARRAADWLVRDLQIAEGRDVLLERARQLAATDTAARELRDHARRRIDEARLALPALELLSEALDSLPHEATAAEWAHALAQLGTKLGLSPFLDTSAEPASQPDRLAWQLIVEHLASLERLDTWLGDAPRKLTRRELIGALSDLASQGSLPPTHDEVGRVRILSAATARTVRAKHLFLAGMSEQAFPSPDRAGRLATEADYRRFARTADRPRGPRRVPPASTVPESTRSQDEMLLFYEVLSSADESLTVSYPALDQRAQTLPPSPYVAEIRRAFDEPARSQLRHAKPQLSPIDLRGAPLSRAAWRIHAVANALSRNVELLAGMFRDERARPLGAAVDRGLRIVHARARREAFGAAEGLLESAAAAQRFNERFGPHHLWSPSQWETYAACPYRFFLDNVLGLQPLGDLVLETDFARRGSRLHQVLAEFHRQWREVCGEKPRTADEEAAEFLNHLRKIIDQRIAGAPAGSIDAALLELDRRQIRKWAASHFDHHLQYQGDCSKLGGAMTPARFEVRFGSRRAGDDESDPDSIDDAFVLEVGGEKIRITGQIDRIDVGTVDGKTVFNVIDYKSGKKVPLRAEHIESGQQLQLPLYVEAAQVLLFGGDARPLAAGYWSMASGFDAKGPLTAKGDDSEQNWSNVQATVRRVVGQFVSDIRGGRFPVASRDDQCTSRCDFNTICRITQIRSLGKTWPPEEQV